MDENRRNMDMKLTYHPCLDNSIDQAARVKKLPASQKSQKCSSPVHNGMSEINTPNSLSK